MAWKGGREGLRDLAEGLVKAGALQFGTFALPDGSNSSYYINLRGLPSYPGVYSLVAEAVSDIITRKLTKVDALCGIPVTGLTIASPVAMSVKKPLIYTRSQGSHDDRMIEGEVRPGWNVVVVDDLTKTGNSVLAAANVVEHEGGEVKHAVVLIDRLEGAKEKLGKAGISLNAVTDVLELANTLYSMEQISKENLDAMSRSVRQRQ